MQLLAAKPAATAYPRTSNVWFNTYCNHTRLAPADARHGDLKEQYGQPVPRQLM